MASSQNLETELRRSERATLNMSNREGGPKSLWKRLDALRAEGNRLRAASPQLERSSSIGARS
eukprot:8706613-Pyramimonas_sp.AAC.1